MDDQLTSARERRKFFLLKAEEAEQQATVMNGEETRAAWREIAISWRYLADEVMQIME